MTPEQREQYNKQKRTERGERSERHLKDALFHINGLIYFSQRTPEFRFALTFLKTLEKQILHHILERIPWMKQLYPKTSTLPQKSVEDSE